LEENAIGKNTIEMGRNEADKVTSTINNNSRSSNTSNSACELERSIPDVMNTE